MEKRMLVKNTSFRLTVTVLLGIILIVIALILYKDFSNKEEAKTFLNEGKKETVTIHNKRIEVRYLTFTNIRLIKNYTYIVSGMIETADNSKFGAVDPNCKVDVIKNQFCFGDFSGGFKVNLETIDMIVTREMYEKIEEGEELEAYCLKDGDKHSCKTKKSIDSSIE